MSVETKTKKGSSLDVNKIICLNNLTYSQLGDVTPVQSRMTRKFYAETNSYAAGSTINFNLDVGSSMVHGPNSWISFRVKSSISGGTAPDNTLLSPSWERGYGSAMNLINESTLIKNEIVERQEHVNVLNWFRSQWRYKQEEIFQGAMSAEGFQPLNGTDKMSYDLTGDGVTFCVPLSRFLGVFGNHSQLIPHQLLSGSRLKLKLEQPDVALQAYTISSGVPHVNDGEISYTIEDPVLHLDMFNLTDAVRLQVSKLSSRKNGLVYNFTTYGTQSVPMTSSHIQSQVGQPVSHALDTFCVVRETSDITDDNANSFKSIDIGDTVKFRYLLGSVSYPEETVDESTVGYTHAQKGWAGLGMGSHKNSITLADYKTGGLGMLSQSLERSHIQNLSGVQLSGSRILQADISKSDYATPLQLDCFLHYVCQISFLLCKRKG